MLKGRLIYPKVTPNRAHGQLPLLQDGKSTAGAQGRGMQRIFLDAKSKPAQRRFMNMAARVPFIIASPYRLNNDFYSEALQLNGRTDPDVARRFYGSRSSFMAGRNVITRLYVRDRREEGLGVIWITVSANALAAGAS